MDKKVTLESLAISIEGLKDHMDKRLDKLSSKIDSVKDDVITTMARSFENEHEYFDKEFKEVKNIAEKVSKYDKKVSALFDSFSLDHKHT